MHKRLSVALAVALAAVLIALAVMAIDNSPEPTGDALGSSVIARYRFAGRLGEFDSGTIVQVVTQAGVIGVYASTSGPGDAPEPSVTLEFAGKQVFFSEFAYTRVDDGAWHDLILVLRPGGTGTAYALDIDGQVVLSGVVEGYAYSHPHGVTMSPQGDLAEWDGIIVSPPLPSNKPSAR